MQMPRVKRQWWRTMGCVEKRQMVGVAQEQEVRDYTCNGHSRANWSSPQQRSGIAWWWWSRTHWSAHNWWWCRCGISNTALWWMKSVPRRFVHRVRAMMERSAVKRALPSVLLVMKSPRHGTSGRREKSVVRRCCCRSRISICYILFKMECLIILSCVVDVLYWWCLI